MKPLQSTKCSYIVLDMTSNGNTAKRQARRLRKTPTSMEGKLWKLLRNRQLETLKFRRQVPIGPYIADFVCFRHRLIIEADGPFHAGHGRDEERDGWLHNQGFQVLRFSNDLIAYNHDAVLAAILRMIETPSEFDAGATPHPTSFGGHLLPQGEKESVTRST